MPPAAVIVVLLPAQMLEDAAVAVMLGKGFTVMATLAVLVHPFAAVPVTVYVVVTAGVAVTAAPVVALSPVAGDQV